MATRLSAQEKKTRPVSWADGFPETRVKKLLRFYCRNTDLMFSEQMFGYFARD